MTGAVCPGRGAVLPDTERPARACMAAAPACVAAFRTLLTAEHRLPALGCATA